MKRSVSVVTPPAAEPVILDEVKAFARIDTADDDPLLATFLSTAIVSAEKYTKRSFINRTLKLSLDLPCGGANDLPDGVYNLPVSALTGDVPNTIALPHSPVSSIVSVVTYGLDDTASTLDPSNYRLDNNRLVLKTGGQWPSGIRQYGGIEITYIAGYGATSSSVPQPIKTAIEIQASELYDSRGMCDEVVSGAAQILQQYKIYG